MSIYRACATQARAIESTVYSDILSTIAYMKNTLALEALWIETRRQQKPPGRRNWTRVLHVHPCFLKACEIASFPRKFWSRYKPSQAFPLLMGMQPLYRPSVYGPMRALSEEDVRVTQLIRVLSTFMACPFRIPR